MGTHLLLTYDFPPIGGGIARWMAELAKRYPAGLAGRVDRAERRRVGGGRELPEPGRSTRRSRRAGSAPSRASCSGRAGWRCWPARPTPSSSGAATSSPPPIPAKWTMERTGTPFGILLHGGDLLILQHQVHQSAIKRKTARRAARPRRRCWSPTASGPAIAASRCWASSRSTRRPTGFASSRWAPTTRSSGPGSTPARCGRGTDWSRGGGCSRSPGSPGTRGSTPRCRRWRGSAPRYPDLRYAVVGTGEEREALEAEARELGVADRVRFLTDVPDRDLPALYNCAEIYLGVSRLMEQRVEGFGISLAEASACGVPVIAGRSGGIPGRGPRRRDRPPGRRRARRMTVAEAIERLLRRSRAPRPARRRGPAGGRDATTTGTASPRDLGRIGHELGATARQAAG